MNVGPRWPVHPSVRFRLTAAYTLLFVGAGVAMLGLLYTLVRQELPSQLKVRILINGVYVVNRNEQLQNGILHSLLIQSAIALVAATLLSAVLGWLLAGRILKRLQRITSTARRLSEETLQERIGLLGPEDELKELADTFDAMLDRLAAAFESQRRFVANASHELRTPLTIQRTLIEIALRDDEADRAALRVTLRQLENVVESSQRLIEGLLVLPISEQGPALKERVDLEALASAALRRVQPEATEDSITIRSHITPVTVLGDPFMLTRLIENLLENAVRHNVRRGWVKIEISTDQDRALIRVMNGGDRIPADQVHSLFEPFRRLGRERKDGAGAGLGLSIVRAVAMAHQGSVDAYAPEKGGLTVTITLPAAPAPAPMLL